MEVVEPGLLQGTVAYVQAQGENFGDFSYETWAVMLENAWGLVSRLTRSDSLDLSQR